MVTGIDATAALARFEQELRVGASRYRRELILAIVERWESDADLTAQSRLRAREVRMTFGS